MNKQDSCPIPRWTNTFYFSAVEPQSQSSTGIVRSDKLKLTRLVAIKQPLQPSRTTPIYLSAVWTTSRPITLTKTMDVISSAVKYNCAPVYVDDVVMFSKSLKKHIAHIRNVLTPSCGAIVSLLLEKCRLFAETVDYPEHFIRSRRLKIASLTMDIITKL